MIHQIVNVYYFFQTEPSFTQIKGLNEDVFTEEDQCNCPRINIVTEKIMMKKDLIKILYEKS